MKRRMIVGGSVVHNAAAYPGKSPEERIQRAIDAAAKERPTVYVGKSLLPETNAPIILTLPEPPSSNKIWRRSGTHMHISAEAKAYKEAVRMLTAKYRTNGQCAFPSGDLSISVLWYRSSKRGDLDNRLKVLLDALSGAIFRNDKQIAHIEACRIDGPAGPISTDSLKQGFMRVEISRLDSRVS